MRKTMRTGKQDAWPEHPDSPLLRAQSSCLSIGALEKYAHDRQQLDAAASSAVKVSKTLPETDTTENGAG